MKVEKLLVTIKHVDKIEGIKDNGVIEINVTDIQMKPVTVTVNRTLDQCNSAITFLDGTITRFNRNILDKNEPSVVLRDSNYLI